MGLGNIKLKIEQAIRPIEPIELFESLTLRGSIENIWEPQAEALKQWTAKRESNDVVIQMNTGGGKTLVGLLIAQSLVNETLEQVMYVCANNQLVEQTIFKAKECGLDPASRYKTSWHNRENYDSGKTFCITNYAAVFHGFSPFKSDSIKAIIFDDAHVAENNLRENYTLNFAYGTDTYKELSAVFKSYFEKSNSKESFEEVVGGDFRIVLFVPTFYTWEQSDVIKKIMVKNNVEEADETKYVWEHLKLNLKHCCFFISGKSIQVSPSVIPLANSPFFKNSVRRIYLTATMPTPASFIRTFGISNPTLISPRGKSGDAQRLFIFLPGKDEEEQKAEALKLVSNHKCCVISPSVPRLKEWQPKVKIYETHLGHDEIIRFSKSKNKEMLGLAARYDGIDLPGDSCRVLILDRLPMGENNFNRFIDQTIQVGTLRSSHTATRIVQAIGRIFRSNTDHGVVLLRGNDLQSWIRKPINQKFLPPLLQKQIILGNELIKAVTENQTRYSDLINGVLSGSKEWDQLYKYIDHIKFVENKTELKWYEDSLLKEKEAYLNIWNQQYEIAARLFSELAQEVKLHDILLYAWYCHWAGLAYLAIDNYTTASKWYWRAATTRADLGRPKEEVKIEFVEKVIGFQVQTITKHFDKEKLEKVLNQIQSGLVYSDETESAEQAVENLGNILGLKSWRPDKKKTGPDVLWQGQDNLLASFELKTGKQIKQYTKDDIKDCNDHHVWLQNNFKDSIFMENLVGRYLKIEEKANPSDELQVIELESLVELVERYKLALGFTIKRGMSFEQQLQNVFEAFNLLWPNCIKNLKSRLAIDLKEN